MPASSHVETVYHPTITLADIEREAILSALRWFKGNRRACAKALGISVRTLQHRLKEYKANGWNVPEARGA